MKAKEERNQFDEEWEELERKLIRQIKEQETKRSSKF